MVWTLGFWKPGLWTNVRLDSDSGRLGSERLYARNQDFCALRDWTPGLWTTERLNSRHLDSGCLDGWILVAWTPGRLDAWTLDSAQLGSWTLDAWTIELWTLGLWRLGRLDSGRLDAWILDDWTLGLWTLGLHVRISKDCAYSIESISPNTAIFGNSAFTKEYRKKFFLRS